MSQFAPVLVIAVTTAFVCMGAAFLMYIDHCRFASRAKETPLPVVPYRDVPADYWKPDDAAAWLTFRSSPAGRKMGVLLNNAITRTAVTATADTATPAHSCGRACGVRDTIALLDSLLPVQISPAGAQSGNLVEPAQQDAADPYAHLAP